VGLLGEKLAQTWGPAHARRTKDEGFSVSASGGCSSLSFGGCQAVDSVAGIIKNLKFAIILYFLQLQIKTPQVQLVSGGV